MQFGQAAIDAGGAEPRNDSTLTVSFGLRRAAQVYVQSSGRQLTAASQLQVGRIIVRQAVLFAQFQNRFRLNSEERWLCFDRQSRNLAPEERRLSLPDPFSAVCNQEDITQVGAIQGVCQRFVRLPWSCATAFSRARRADCSSGRRR